MNFGILLIVNCCKSVWVYASEEVSIRQRGKTGRFNFYKMGTNARAIYKNADDQYLYLVSNLIGSYWVV